MRFKNTVPCSRPLVPAWTDDFGNVVGEERAAVSFQAVFVPPGTQTGSRIVDGVLREITTTKPVLMVDRRAANAAAVEAGAVKSTDSIIVNGEPGWQVDGDPADYTHPRTGRKFPLWIELRKAVG